MTRSDASIAALSLAKACPWCEAREVWFWEKAVPDRLAVCCSNPNCAATGPLAPTETEAVLRWNSAIRRPEPKVSHRLQRLLDEANPVADPEDELRPRPLGKAV